MKSTHRTFTIVFLVVLFALCAAGCRYQRGGNPGGASSGPATAAPANPENPTALAPSATPQAEPATTAPEIPTATLQAPLPTSTAQAVQATQPPAGVDTSADDLQKLVDQLNNANQAGDPLNDLP